MGKCQSFLFIDYHSSKHSKGYAGDTLKASPLAPHLISSKLHLQGPGLHVGSKHTCSILAHQNAANKKGQGKNSSTSATDVNSRKCCLVRCVSSEPPRQRIFSSTLLTAFIGNGLVSCFSHLEIRYRPQGKMVLDSFLYPQYQR